MSKQASMRVAVDRYHGVATPAPDQEVAARPAVMTAESQARIAAQRGTPPPAYDTSGGRAQSALGVPQPAHTKKEMLNRTQTWGTDSVVSAPRGSQQSRPGTREGRRSPGPGMMRAASPQPQQYQQRSRSPAPGMAARGASPQPQQQYRSRSPAPGMQRAASPQPQSYQQNPNMRARSPNPGMMHQHSGSQGSQYRAASPNPYARQSRGQPNQGSRQGSGMEMQLSSQDVTRYDGSGSGRNRQNMRPNSSFGGDRYQQPQGQGYDNNGREARGRGSVEVELRRERSKSLANIPFRAAPQQQAALYYGIYNPPLSPPPKVYKAFN